MSTDHDHSPKNEIWVYDFTEKSATKFRSQVLERSMDDPHAVIPIYIDSYGGCVDSLAKMIETMDEVPNPFLTVASGKAMSCGAILLSHGDVRYCGKYSRIMVHNVSSASWGDVYTMKEESAENYRLNKIFMGLLAENCGMTYKELQEKIKATHSSKEIWMSANSAKKFGIVDEVGTPVLRSMMLYQVETLPKKQRQSAEEPKKKKKKK